MFELRFADVVIGDRPAWVAACVVRAATAGAPAVVAGLDWFGESPATPHDLEDAGILRVGAGSAKPRPPTVARASPDDFAAPWAEAGVISVAEADAALAQGCSRSGGSRAAAMDLAIGWLERFEPERYTALAGAPPARRARPAPRSLEELAEVDHLARWDEGARREARPRLRDILSECVRDVATGREDAIREATAAINRVAIAHPGAIETAEREQLASLLTEIGASAGVTTAADIVDRHREW